MRVNIFAQSFPLDLELSVVSCTRSLDREHKGRFTRVVFNV